MLLIIFQFQNGTIRRGVIFIKERVRAVFQFQNGTIRRNCKPLPPPYTTLFQFQNGTIRRVLFEEGWFKIVDFNSKMVRLEELPCTMLNGKKVISIPKWYD